MSRQLGLFWLPFVAALLFMGWAPVANAVCVTSNTNHGNTNGRKTYRINGASFDLISTVSRDDGAHAVIQGADLWNEQGNAGTFRLGSSTSLTAADMPSTLAACQSAGINFSLVVVEDASGSKAVTSGACFDTSGKATQFIIKIRTKDGSGNPWNWATGNIGATQWDLVQTLSHEMGHTQRLGHPSGGEQAVMDPTEIGTNRKRDLYQWDLECLEQISGHRSRTVMRRIHSGAAIGSESSTSSGHAKVSSGLTHNTGTWLWSTANKRNPCFGWTATSSPATNCTTADLGIDSTAGVGPVNAIWREDEDMNRVFYGDAAETPTYAWDGKHYMRYQRSDDGFNSTNIAGYLRSCDSMTGFLTCSSSSYVFSGREISVAWDNYNNRATTAWINQNRLNDSASREVMIATGFVNNFTLPVPSSLGVQSSIAPAVACNAFSAGGYDCIVAYTDQSASFKNVRIKRFWSSTGTDRYNIHIASGFDTIAVNVPTASRVAAYYHDSKFWVVVRPMRTNQNLELYSSSDGQTWTSEGSLGYSDIGASAINYWTISNMVTYAR